MTALIVAAIIAIASLVETHISAVSGREGTLWQAKPSHGPNYLAIPEGPGVKVRIDGPAGSVTMVSTDAGPALSMQRKGRIGDLAIGRWREVCGVKREPLGYCTVTIVYLANIPLPPSTDTT